MTTKSKTKCLDTLPLKQNSYSYWNSFNAILLFNPIAGDYVINCIIRREELLRRGKFDDDLLLNYFDEDLLFEVGFTVNDLNINLDKYEDNALEQETKDVCECCGEKL